MTSQPSYPQARNPLDSEKRKEANHLCCLQDFLRTGASQDAPEHKPSGRVLLGRAENDRLAPTASDPQRQDEFPTGRGGF